MRYVVIESPYAGEVKLNLQYLERCMLDSIDRGEFPLAGHMMYTRVLDDSDPAERQQGIKLHLALIDLISEYGLHLAPGDSHPHALLAVYTDRGISPGMQLGMDHAARIGLRIEFRKLDI